MYKTSAIKPIDVQSSKSSTQVKIVWVIRQKGGSQIGCFKKTKQAKFSRKQTFLTP